MGSDRRLNRRYIEKPAQLKKSKITIEKGKTSRKKGRDTDVTVESPEFQLLVKLFVPSKLLIHNNRISHKELSTYLPIIINSSYLSLNFELHIFLSSIVTSYVASWYSLKLNTENFEFLEIVYTTICEFVKDFARRVLEVMALPQLLKLLNKWAYIVDSHIRQTYSEGGIPMFARQELAKRGDLITSKDELKLENLTARFLEQSHIIFEPEQKIDIDRSRQTFSSNMTTEEDDFEEANYEPSLRLIYLRLVVKNVVIVAFDPAGTETLNTPVSSAIAMNLTTLVLADLVLDRAISKLSSPKFILQTVIGKIGLNLRNQLAKKKAKTQDSLYQRMTQLANAVYSGINATWNFVSKTEEVPTLETSSILFSPFLSLIDGITNIKCRKPILVSILSICRSIITSSCYFTKKIETTVGRYIINQTSRSHFLLDEAQSSIVRMLRDIVFGNDVTETNPTSEPSSIEELAHLWVTLLSKDLSSSLPMGISLESFLYLSDSSEELRKCVEELLRIFDPTNGDIKGPYSEESDLNKLLIIRLFDSIIQSLYPELVEKIVVTV